MTAFLRRIGYALGLIELPEHVQRAYDDPIAYLDDFGPNVPVEDLGGKPVENNQPVYPGREKAP